MSKDTLGDFIGCGSSSLRVYCPRCGHDQFENCLCPPGKEENMKIPELYPENLDTLKHIMARLDLFGNIDGVFEVAIRVRIDDLDTWAVIGYGESGDPCL